jgi:hypothetical protein
MSARKIVESDMRDYKKRVGSSKEQLMVLWSELGIQKEELIVLKYQYFKMEKELNKSKQEHQEFWDYIYTFEV